MRTTTQPVEVAAAHGTVPAHAIELAREKVGAVLRLAPAPVLFARVTLAHETARSIERPAVAKAVLDVNGRIVRAHVAAARFDEAVNLLEAKLRHGLEILAEKRRAARHRPARTTAGNWRHGMLPTDRPEWFPRPAARRELVRHESYPLHRQSVAEAAEDLESQDRDWTLFTERDSRADALLERTAEGFRLTLATAAIPAAADLEQPVEVHLAAPRMALAVALQLLDELDTAVVFFVDAETGRGRVVYRRYDGHYGTLAGAGVPTTTGPETVGS